MTIDKQTHTNSRDHFPLNEIAACTDSGRHSRSRRPHIRSTSMVAPPAPLHTHHVSRLLNFFVTTLPRSMPRRSTMRCARSGWDVPEKTLMLGILDCILRPLDFSKLSRTKLFARIGLADRTGITQNLDNVEKMCVPVCVCTKWKKRIREHMWRAQESFVVVFVLLYISHTCAVWDRARGRERRTDMEFDVSYWENSCLIAG